MNDFNDIFRLTTRFFNALDRRDLTQMSHCFTPTGRMGMFAADLDDESTAHWIEGRDAIEGFSGWLTRYDSTMHQIGNLDVEIDGSIARGFLNATVFLSDSGAIQVRGIGYRDRFELVDGEWYFTSRMHKPLWQFDGAAVPIHVPDLGRM